VKNLARTAATAYGSKKDSEISLVFLTVLEVDEFVQHFQMTVFEMVTYNIHICDLVHWPSELITIFSKVMKLRFPGRARDDSLQSSLKE
jgi:hypothetical protein